MTSSANTPVFVKCFDNFVYLFGFLDHVICGRTKLLEGWALLHALF